jgi:hypothetical protein
MSAGNSAARTAADVCRQFELSDPARALLGERQSPGAFFSLLVQERLYPDALRFAAHYLPKREAVWWGCLCAWQVYRPEPPAKEGAALEAVVGWVREPTEANRRDAEKAGREAGVGSVAGGLALAAYLSEGSIAPPGQPPVDPKPTLTAQTVAGAVVLAARQAGAARMAEHARHFAVLAAEVAEGRLRWETQPGGGSRTDVAGRR